MLPLRQTRFCCAELKERNNIPELRFAIRSFGVRKAESVKRNLNRDSIETFNRTDLKDKQKFHFDDAIDVKQTGACYTNNYFYINPLAYWSTDYLWDYIDSEKLETNPLYSKGFERVGCILCPMASTCQRRNELSRHPKFEKRFIKLADDIIQLRLMENLPNKYAFKTGKEYFNLWLDNDKLSVTEQYNLFNYGEQI